MNERRSRFFAAIAAAGLLALPSLGWAQEPYTLRFGNLNLLQTSERPYITLINQEAGEETETAGRWIGVGVGQLPDVLRSHLKLEHGVLIEDVYPDSPAAKAGIERNDILLAVNGEKITQPDQVRDAIAKAEEGQSLKFRVLHAGDEQTFNIVPAKRPTDVVAENPTETASGAAASQQEFLKHQHQALKALERALANRQAAGMMFMRPGIVTQKPVKLPRDVTVNIRHFNGKKMIAVERGKDKWEVTEDTLDQLPEELREPVGALVHGPMPLGVRIQGDDVLRVSPDAIIGNTLRVDPVLPQVRALRSAEGVDDDQFDAVMDELKALRKQVDELQRTLKDSN